MRNEARFFQHTEVARGGRPFVRKPARNLTGGRRSAKVNRQQDLSPRGMGQRGDHGVESREFLGRVVDQSGSTSQIVNSSSTGPIGSQMAMISGV